MLSSKKIETVEHERNKCRVLPVDTKKTRSRSLSKIRDTEFFEEQTDSKHHGVKKVNKSLFHPMKTVSKHGINQSTKEKTGEVPVVIDEVTKYITGVNEYTTCQDIIKAILDNEIDTLQTSHVQNYLLFERWKKVERPLRHSAKILNIWNAWGHDRYSVRFVLRRTKKGNLL